jgi:hypothetical protein
VAQADRDTWQLAPRQLADALLVRRADVAVQEADRR